MLARLLDLNAKRAAEELAAKVTGQEVKPPAAPMGALFAGKRE